MGKNLMKSNQISAGRTQNSGFGHKSEMELILCFITCLKNKKRAPYAWECWTDWSDVHRLPALVSRRTDGFKISPCPPGGRNAHSSTDDSVFLFFFFVFSSVFIITHSMGRWCIKDQVRRAIGKGMFWVSLGPLSAVKMRRSILVGTAEKEKFHSSEQSQNRSDFLSVDFWWRRQKLCKVRDGAWAQLKFPAGFH